MKNKLIHKILLSIIPLIIVTCTTPDEPEFDNPFEQIEGPAILLNPLEIQKAPNTSFVISLRLKDVKNVTGIYADIRYDVSVLSLVSLEVLETLLKSTGGEVISFIETDSIRGIIVVSIGIAGGNPRYIQGSGDIVRFKFHIQESRDTKISLCSSCRLTDRNLNDLPINQLIGAEIFVE